MIRVKQNAESDLIKKARKSLEAVLSKVPFVEIKKMRSNVRIDNKEIDLIFEVLVSGKLVDFIVEVKSQGEPRLVRVAVAQFQTYLQDYPDSYGILVAPYLSDASRQICKEAGIGCIDLAGNAFLSFKNIYIDRSGIPNPFRVKRISKSLFSPKSSRILRVLLSDPTKRWYVEEMSREASISIGLVSRVKQALLANEWVKEEKKRFYLVKPEEPLNEWLMNYSYTRNLSFSFYSGLSEDQLEAAIRKESEKRNWRYGLALFSGARKVAPFVRFLRFFTYIDADIEEIANALQLKKVDSGPNVTLLKPYDEGVFYGLQEINGINVVSDLQLYLDLKGFKGRGEEAAQAIFEQRLKPKW
ncbi:MAG TPA: hypothetical protein ENG95_01210 [Nitrospirae bacterium]|nr:hypothetical protein BMS3Abin10_01385 [bacterium BMS3Abin10]GBE39513.1 hypothetical protein BMS3Bbin08_02137 [bacterium BMS3Bbin08]HDO25246.1 hypothetical protein [Nitrospirota bacterium]